MSSVKKMGFEFEGHKFELMVDIGGEWDRMVHIVDHESLKQQTRPDGVSEMVPETIISGAKWNGSEIVVKPSDVYNSVWENWLDLLPTANRLVAQMLGN